MSFFGKLKSKLFKSSSKLDEGLDAIVSDGGEETPTSNLPPARVPEPPVQTPPSDVAPDPLPELPSQPEPEIVPDPLPELPGQPEPEIVPDPVPEAPSQPEPEIVPDPLPEAPAQPEPEITPEPTPTEIPQRDLPPSRGIPFPAPDNMPKPVDPEPAPVEEVPPTQDAPEPAAPTQLRTQNIAPRLDEVVPSTEDAPKPGLLGRLLGRSAAPTEIRRELDDDMLEQLEDLLIQADMGVDTALRVTANIAEGRFGKKLSVREIKELLAGEIARIMEPVARPLPLYPTKPQVVLVVGVNGSGKTTTIGKLASQFRAAGKKVVIAAGDTFRAAAVEQLQVWGDRAGVPVLTAPEGSDPASLAFDAMTKAQADGADLLMIDTAGRLQNRADLMEELAKIVRVIRKKDPDAPHNTLLVLDATTGQNAISQVKTFQELADVSGLVMTKLDGTAKGGVLVALADKFGLPIHAIGVGEQIDDLSPFDPEEFAAALTGLSTE